MSEERVPLKLEIDISEFLQNLDMGEGAIEKLKEGTENASGQIEQDFEKAAESVDETTESTKKSGEGFKTYKDAMIAIQGPLGGVASRMTALRNVFGSLTQFIKGSTVSLRAFKLALAATGVGLFVVAIGTLVSLLRRLQPIMDGIERVFGVFAIAMDFAATRLGAFLGLNEDVNMSLADTIENNDRLIKQQQQLRDIETELIVEYAKLEKAIRESEAAVRDETASLEDRGKALNDLERFQEELIETELVMAKNRRDNAEQVSAQAEDDAEAQKELAEARAEVFRIEGRRAQMERRFFRERQRLTREVEAEEKRVEEERQKRYESEISRNRSRVLFMEKWKEDLNDLHGIEESVAITMQNIDESLKGSLESSTEAAMGSIADAENQINIINDRIRNATLDSERQRLREQKAIYQEQLDAYGVMADEIQNANIQISQQAIASDIERAESAREGAAAVIKTIRAEIIAYAIRNAFASGGPLAPILAGVFIGLANNIMGRIPGFAEGGSFLTSGATPIMVGDNPGGVERVDVTPISSPNLKGPQGGGIMEALENVQWEAQTRLDAGDLVFVMRKKLRQESNLGGDGTL